MAVDYDLSSESITPRTTRLSEAMHRCLFEEAADGIIIADAATTRFLEVNPRVEELTGWKRSELLGMSISDLIAPASLAEKRLRWGLLREDRVIFTERLIRRKDGRVFAAELSGRRLSEGRVLGLLRDISQRRKLETDLCLSQARYRSAVRVAPDAIAQADLAGRLQMVSPATLRLFGYSDEQELLGQQIFELVAPQERARALRMLAVYQAGAASQATHPLWLRRKAGELVLCEVSAAPVRDDAGELVSHALFARDITERSRVEAKIRKLSRLYALRSQVNQAVIRSREREDLFQTVCEVAVQHGGFRMAWIGVPDAATQRVRPVAHAGHEAGYLAAIQSALDGSSSGACPTGRALREGGLVVCDDVGAERQRPPWREAALARGYRTLASVALCVEGCNVGALTVCGDQVGFFCADERRLMQELGEDISAALAFMEAQAERRRAELALRASEERFRSLVQNSMDGIAMYADSGTILYQSPAVSRILGRDPSELVGLNLLELIHPDDRAQARSDLAALRAAEGCSIKRDRRYLHRAGGYRWIESVATNLLHVPSVGAIVDNFRDISERMRAEQEREQLLTELSHAQKLDSIGRLAGGVAHDFNNMLAVILGSVELALADARTPPQIQGFLREIHDAAKRSAALTRQLLTFARKLPMEPKLIDVNVVVEGALKLLRRLAGANVKLHWRPGQQLWPIEMDPTQLGQVLTNLTVNARDAICDVGDATIETANCSFDAAYCAQHAHVAPGDYVRLSVSDTGVGVSPEVQAQMFEPFFTTKAPGRGTGLGLATVYGIIKQYKGFIQVHSVEGCGARFDIYVPRHTTEPAGAQPVSRLPRGPASNTATILIVEGEPQVLALVTTLLRNLGYRVVSAATPEAALDLVCTGQVAPELLLSDVVTSTMSGAELAHALRGQRPGLKAILLSAELCDPGANSAQDFTILHKPFTLQALAETVQTLLSGA